MYTEMGLLHDLGMQYQTDKATYHKYMDFYEQFFGPIRFDVRKVIEIGVHRGSSIRVWLDYFPNATIYGIDYIHCELVSQHDRFVYITKNALLEEVYSSFADNDIDILIDDGSHKISHQQDAIKFYWSKIKHGGYFVMEDLSTSAIRADSESCLPPSRRKLFANRDRLPTTYDFLKNNAVTQDAELNNIRDAEFGAKHFYNRDGTFHYPSSITCVIEKL